MERCIEAAPEETAEVVAAAEPTPAPEPTEPTEPVPPAEKLQELIRGVYERKNQEKLAELPGLFTKYAGQELVMYKMVCRKYGEEAIRFKEPPKEQPKESADASAKPSPGDTPATSSGGYATSSTAPATAAQEEEEKNNLSHRERGNLFFKQGKMRKAIKEYEESFALGEDNWILALSNRAIAHLKLKEFEEALSAANRCIDQEGAQEVPLKVHLTKFK